MGTYVSVSSDGGRTFAAPTPTTTARWAAVGLERGLNGPGFRDDCAVTVGGRAVFAYGDGRLAEPAPARSWGRSAVFAAVVDP